MKCGIFDFYTQDRNGKRTGCPQAAYKLPALYLILRAGAGVDAGVGRAYEVLLTRPPLASAC
jgi:hypothetical protein